MGHVTLEPVTQEQVSQLRQHAIETFTETFGHDNTPEQLEAYFNEAYAEKVLAEEITSSDSQVDFVLVDDQIAGYRKVNWGKEQTEQELEDAFEIQRLYVLKKYQGLGLGKLLFEDALSMAAQKGFTWAWLGVWEHNTKAQGFYAKYGFEKFSEHSFPVSEDKVDVDWLLRKRLN